MLKNNKNLWYIWTGLTLLCTAFYAYSFNNENATVFIPGKTSYAHYQFEVKCASCHGKAFGGKEELQKSCVNCHAQELKAANDSHPKSKFTDPRNADLNERIDARYCISCHVEHKPEITKKMAVTVAEDICSVCHMDIAKDRSSHQGMKFDSCDDAGCHNFHDNRALYEDFIAKHLNEPDVRNEIRNIKSSRAQDLISLDPYPTEIYPYKILNLSDADAPNHLLTEQMISQEWHQSKHANAGVNCSACHLKELSSNRSNIDNWIANPDSSTCDRCHFLQQKDFQRGQHGIRIAQELEEMSPGNARLPMKRNAKDKRLNCTSCHSDHLFDTEFAQVDACLTCHNDEHSLAYKKSKHYKLWLNKNSQLSSNTGVSCSDCHLPKKAIRENQMMITQHNQSSNLRPNEKMIRGVCMECHGLTFSIDALSDGELLKQNFNKRPTNHIASVDMVKRRLKNKPKSENNKGGEKQNSIRSQ